MDLQITFQNEILHIFNNLEEIPLRKRAPLSQPTEQLDSARANIFIIYKNIDTLSFGCLRGFIATTDNATNYTVRSLAAICRSATSTLF